MAKPDVSVVIPALNARETIEQALLSVLSQEGVAEVVVVDDGSTDGTADVVRALNDPRIRIVAGPQTGVAGALNCALQAATCEFVAVCDSDDWWSADRLAWQRRMIGEKPDFIAVSGAFASATPEGAYVADLAVDGPSGDVTDELLQGSTPTHFCAWLTRRRFIEEVGFIREWFETAQEMDLQVRLAEVGRVWHEPRVCYHYRLHNASITHTQPSGRRIFFEQSVRRFALQRRESGADDLMRGAPPSAPDATGASAAPETARRQIAGHLEGRAWRQFAEGRRLQAMSVMTRALATDPLSLTLWRGIAVMAGKIALGRR